MKKGRRKIEILLGFNVEILSRLVIPSFLFLVPFSLFLIPFLKKVTLGYSKNLKECG
jgi:hypothetical protein